MKQLGTLIFFLLSMSAFGQKEINTIAFGSCAFQFAKQDIWPKIKMNDPDCWIWLGDNIYGDTEKINVLERKYAKLKANAYYQEFSTTTPVYATWDDHDYGGNNLGKHYPTKEESRLAFLNFFNEPGNSPRWDRPGVYTSYDLGADERSVKLILLDTRYNRDDPSPDGDMLGPEQWQWLEQELTTNKATITIIGSSIQFVSQGHQFESWGNFPQARQRLINLLGSTETKGAIFISGDRHLSEISMEKGTEAGFRLYDFTSSGLTHGIPKWIVNDSEARLGHFYHKKNFGIINIDWHNRKLLLETHNEDNDPVLGHIINFSELGL